MKTNRKTIASIAVAAIALIVVTAASQSVNHTQTSNDNDPFRDNASGPVTFQNGNASAELVGHWRYTRILGGAGGPMMATDFHLVLNSDGTCSSWSRSAYSESDPDTGRWTVRARSLIFTDNDGASHEVPFMLDGDSMMFPNTQPKMIWERVR